MKITFVPDTSTEILDMYKIKNVDSTSKPIQVVTLALQTRSLREKEQTEFCKEEIIHFNGSLTSNPKGNIETIVIINNKYINKKVIYSREKSALLA